MGGIEYDVKANLRTAGTFQKEAATLARGADAVGKSYSSMSARLVTAGERVRGTFGQTARDLARMGAMAGAAGLVGAVAAATREGVRFNSAMEQGALGLGTMYTTFGLASNSAAVMSGEMSEFTKSVELAKSMQSELFDIAKKSPATFEDMTTAYTAMAPGVSAVTGDLLRQRDLMKKIAVLGFTTGGDFKQLGMDVGRIVQGVAGQDVAVFRTLAPNIKKAFEKATGQVAEADFAQQFNKLAKADGEAALSIFEGALAGVSEEINSAFGSSFEGVMATAMSEVQVLAGAFGKPIMDSMTKAALRATGPGGLFEGEGLKTAASFAGKQLARAADHLFRKLEAGAIYVRDNWSMIAHKIREAGVAAGAALKAAAVVASARMVAGNAMILAGKGGAAAQTLGKGAGGIGDILRARAKTTHMGIARGMKGQRGGGMAGGMGRGMGKMFGKLDSKSMLGIFRGFDKGILKFAAMGTVLTAAGTAAGVLGLAFGAVGVVVGGLAAYVSSSWDEIKKSIVTAIESGRISLIPLITSLYTFYERLRLVGVALVGNNDAAGAMVGGLSMMTSVMDFASVVVGGTIKAIAIMVGAWGALKLGMMGVMKVILAVAELGAKIGVVDETTIKRARANYENFGNGVDDTFTRADALARAGDAISKAQLDPMKMEMAKKKAKSLEGALSDMLSGKGKDGKGGRGKGGTRIGKVEVVINTTDPDPDRLFASFIKKTTDLSDRRVQPYEALEQGT